MRFCGKKCSVCEKGDEITRFDGTVKHVIVQYGIQERVKSACEYNIKPRSGFVWLIACPYILSRTKKSFSKKIFVRYVPLSHKPELRSCTLCTS
jgi:hypothetical protein